MSLADKIRLKKEREAQKQAQDNPPVIEDFEKLQTGKIQNSQKGETHDVLDMDKVECKGLLCPNCKKIGGKFSVSQTTSVIGGVQRVRTCSNCDTAILTIEQYVKIKEPKIKK